ncbi:MAG: NADH-quinone oxidoreductase subunit J [Planctomycetes bacterium]|nr:NADH-quinone oxidoreductase subunit J [Planctomycetota bacterium]
MATLVLVPAFAIVFSRNIVHMAFWLLGTLMGVSGLYLLLGADFLGMTQIFVYIGGINVLLLFGIMLTRSEPVYVRRLAKRPKLAPGLIIGAFTAFTLVSALLGAGWRNVPGEPTETAGILGAFLLSEYILPFEIISVLLLVVLIGAAYIARRGSREGAE